MFCESCLCGSAGAVIRDIICLTRFTGVFRNSPGSKSENEHETSPARHEKMIWFAREMYFASFYPLILSSNRK